MAPHFGQAWMTIGAAFCPGLCSTTTQVAVPRNGHKGRSIALSLATRTTPPPGKTTGRVDSDRLTLKCVAP